MVTAGLCNLETGSPPWSRYLGYGLVLYTPSICHPVRILGNDYPGMETVARLHKSAVYRVSSYGGACYTDLAASWLGFCSGFLPLTQTVCE